MSVFVKHPCEEAFVDARSAPTASSSAGAWVLLVAIVGSGMTFLDATAVNVALPAMQHDLHADAAAVQWVIEAYALFLSALLLTGGSLGDIFGRRRIFVLGIVIFAVASLGCALAHTIQQIDIARGLQGAGAALAVPGSLALISANFGKATRGRAIGTWSGFASITAAIGPLLGGWLAQYASWRYVFLINLPLAAIVVAAALLRVPESRSDSDNRRVDVVGSALVTIGLGALTYGLIRLQSQGLDHTTLAALLLSVVLLAAFFAWEAVSRAPMTPLVIFRNATFSLANVYTFLLYAALGGGLYFVPFVLQNVQGYSPSAAGAAMLPFILIMFVSSRWSGGLVAAIGARIPMVVGAIVAGFGFLAYARIGIGGSYWTTFFPASVILGVGAALFVAPLTTTVMTALGNARAGTASGINNAVSRVAGLVALAALGIVLVSTLNAQLDKRIPTLGLSPQTVAAVARERDVMASGKAPASLPQPDRTRVQAALSIAYNDGFQRTMLYCALLAYIAAFIALRIVTPSAVEGPLPTITPCDPINA